MINVGWVEVLAETQHDENLLGFASLAPTCISYTSPLTRVPQRLSSLHAVLLTLRLSLRREDKVRIPHDGP